MRGQLDGGGSKTPAEDKKLPNDHFGRRRKKIKIVGRQYRQKFKKKQHRRDQVLKKKNTDLGAGKIVVYSQIAQ